MAKVIRLRPLRVLVVSDDEPFRAVSAMLVSRRGCRVFSLSGAYAAAELIARERIDVVVVDGAARRRALEEELAVTAGLAPAVGIVSVGESREAGSTPFSMIEKWSPFEELFAAILSADRERVCERPARAAEWPASQGFQAQTLD